MTDAKPYFYGVSMTKGKSLIFFKSPPEVNVIKLFSFVTDEGAEYAWTLVPIELNFVIKARTCPSGAHFGHSPLGQTPRGNCKTFYVRNLLMFLTSLSV